ncbi:anthranilate phosphoribosyltransferase [Sulfobacillus harzensis]|uniref:Anthranilate phosphoribosyltransferase n=1 Tax=Sulfobacillus harzensis TaxID=2729629 RepID=A0A7Y0L337_9FIRM|nr:anthranilate phosphoribosyltransferase [Sulfobacillus harzensis]NMP22418.1 anthranilate phosphoribosyltransferase [Sulfobacillus harzensis]
MSEAMIESLELLSRGQALTVDQAYRLMDAIMAGQASPAQIGGALMALRVRGETVEELTGFARAMRDHATPVAVRQHPLIDTCGTGGDRSFTFNVSTVSAFVVAGAGLHVAKHGNRSATSKSGSADLLEALGVELSSEPDRVADLIDEVGFGFLFAQHVHTSMRHAGPVRRELGVRTVFNLLGPLTNPCAPEYQLLGVFAAEWVRPIAEVLGQLGVRRAMVVHGHGGLDEVSLSGPTRFCLVEGTTVQEGELTPEDLGLSRYAPGSFVGGEPATNAIICQNILGNAAPGPHLDMVLANAGVALYVGGVVPSPKDGVALARQVIQEGKALHVLEQLVAASHLQQRRDA